MLQYLQLLRYSDRASESPKGHVLHEHAFQASDPEIGEFRILRLLQRKEGSGR